MKSVLISGAGIAGPTLAYWLLRHGFRPTIVERAPAPRTGGYVIDFWGLGYDVAEKMELLPELNKHGYRADELRLVDGRGRRIGGFSTEIFQKTLNNRFLSILRGDLAAAIYEVIEAEVEMIFGDSIESIAEHPGGLEISFNSGINREFDILVGADGLHSIVRSIVFGAQSLFENKLGYSVAAFSTESYRPRDEGAYVCYSSPGKQIARFALHNDRTVFFLIFSDDARQNNTADHVANIRKLEAVLDDPAWECKQILEVLNSCDDLYFDSASQIRMPSWSKGRIALVGDAAFCPSLLAGQGAALAMAAGYILAGELKRAEGNHTNAFEAYEQRLKSFITRKQQAAQNFGGWFAPTSELTLFIRNQITRLFSIPLIADKFVNDTVADKFQLPNY